MVYSNGIYHLWHVYCLYVSSVCLCFGMLIINMVFMIFFTVCIFACFFFFFFCLWHVDCLYGIWFMTHLLFIACLFIYGIYRYLSNVLSWLTLDLLYVGLDIHIIFIFMTCVLFIFLHVYCLYGIYDLCHVDCLYGIWFMTHLLYIFSAC